MSDQFVDKNGKTRTRKTHCVNGHEFTADARWHVNHKGYKCRVCEVCDRERMRRKRANPEFKANEAEKMRRWRVANPEDYKATYTKQHEKKKQVLLDARKSGCIKCGESDPSCLDFHHRDPSTKEGDLGRVRRFSIKRILAEIAKCDVLCANCHRKHHRDLREKE